MKQKQTKNKQIQEKDKLKENIRAYAKYSGIAFKMLAVILIGLWSGIKIDDSLEIQYPIFTVGLTLLSVVLSIYITIKDLIK